MRIGDKVVLKKDVTHDEGVLQSGSEWVVSNIIQIQKEKLALISDDSDKVYAVKFSSVAKIKQ